jgi:hypothetical protein
VAAPRRRVPGSRVVEVAVAEVRVPAPLCARARPWFSGAPHTPLEFFFSAARENEAHGEEVSGVAVAQLSGARWR